MAQGAHSPAEFRIFALGILPAIVFLGVATFVRIVETAVEDNIAAMAINRIRGYYLELAGDEARAYFTLGPHDDRQGVLANAGLNLGLARKFDSVATVIALINSISPLRACPWLTATSAPTAGAFGLFAGISAAP